MSEFSTIKQRRVAQYLVAIEDCSLPWDTRVRAADMIDQIERGEA